MSKQMKRSNIPYIQIAQFSCQSKHSSGVNGANRICKEKLPLYPFYVSLLLRLLYSCCWRWNERCSSSPAANINHSQLPKRALEAFTLQFAAAAATTTTTHLSGYCCASDITFCLLSFPFSFSVAFFLSSESPHATCPFSSCFNCFEPSNATFPECNIFLHSLRSLFNSFIRSTQANNDNCDIKLGVTKLWSSQSLLPLFLS